MTRWHSPADPSAMDEARETMDAMVECYHPADRPSKWRDLAEFAAQRAKAEQEHNDKHGVPDR